MSPNDEIFSSKILIVDDDKYIVSLLLIHLKLAGFSKVRTETDSRKAMLEYMEFRPDLLILDLIMPHVDGFMILEKLASLKSTSHNVLVLTALNDPGTRRKAMDAGARDFLTKPFNKEQAVSRIKNLLISRKRIDALADSNRELEKISKRMGSELANFKK